jgi:hypothetical protein
MWPSAASARLGSSLDRAAAKTIDSTHDSATQDQGQQHEFVPSRHYDPRGKYNAQRKYWCDDYDHCQRDRFFCG